MQFSLRFLFALIFCAAAALGLLIYATPFWAAVVFSLTMTALLASLVLAVAVTDAARTYWIGFAIFGWGYWLVLCSPILTIDPSIQHNWRLGPQQGPPLVSSRLLHWIYLNVLPQVHAEPQLDNSGRVVNRTAFPTEIEFLQVGHALCALSFALSGGAIGRLAYLRLRRSPSARSSSSADERAANSDRSKDEGA